jgi:hypothetical protein
MGTFIDSIKNLFNGLTAKTQSTASTSDYIQLYNGTTGEPNGKIKLDNLAAVLGVPRFIGGPIVNENDDLDNLTEYPFYRCNNSSITRTVSNMPEGANTGYGFLLLYLRPSTGENGNQILIQQTNIWIRFKANSSQATWGGWCKILTENP